MNPLLAYLLFILAVTTAWLAAVGSWWAAVPFVLFLWLFGEWLSLTLTHLIRTAHVRAQIRALINERRTR